MTKLCAVDADCPSTLVCLTNTTWFLTSGRNTRGDGCSTSAWYGWGGPNGTDMNTPTVKWWLGSSATLMLGSLFAFSLAARILYDLAIRLKKPKDPKILTTVQVAFGSLFLFAMQMVIFIREFFPEHATKPDYSGSETEKSSTDDAVMYQFYGLALAAILQALISVAVLWILVANASQRLRSAAASERELAQVQRAGLAFEFLITVAFLVILGMKKFSLIAIPVAVTAVVVFAAYITGIVKMRRLLLQAMGSTTTSTGADNRTSKHYQVAVESKGEGPATLQSAIDAERRAKFMAVLRDITFHTALLLGLGIAVAITYIIVMILTFVSNWPEFCTNDSAPCYTVVNWNFVSMFLLFINFGIIHYIRNSVTTMMRGQDSRNNESKTSSHGASGGGAKRGNGSKGNKDGLEGENADLESGVSTTRHGPAAVVSSPQVSSFSYNEGSSYHQNSHNG